MTWLISEKYEVLSKIGQGGMGAVYKARHRALDVLFALKLLPQQLVDHPELVARFEREARVMAQLNHANIVRVVDIASDGDLYYLVEEYVEGENLDQYVRGRGPLPLSEALQIAHQVAQALMYAHGKGVTHRDIKPSNILLEGEAPVRAKVADFGIAKIDGAGEHTQTGEMLGSLRYSAPEQLGYRPRRLGPDRRERVVVDGRADVYALGLVIFEMCEGRSLFAGLEPTEILPRLLMDTEPIVPEFTRTVPDHIRELVARAIPREPDERFQTMTELAREIERSSRFLAESDLEASGDAPTQVFTAAPQDVAAAADADVTAGAPIAPAARLDEERGTERWVRPMPAAAAPSPRPRSVEQPRAWNDETRIQQDAAKRTIVSRRAEATSRDEREPARSNAWLYGAAAGVVVALFAAGLYAKSYFFASRPLAWHETSPSPSDVDVKAGEPVRLAASIDEPGSHEGVRYAWVVDGRERAQGPSWEYQPTLDEGGTTREIEVVASLGPERIERTWRVHVAKELHRPIVAAMDPATDQVSLSTHDTQRFSITVSAPDRTPLSDLSYTWERNGESVASSAQPAWTLRDASQKDTEVKVTVSDAAGVKIATQTWKIAVEKRPPRILSVMPPNTAKFLVEEGRPVDFVIRAEDPGEDDRLVYSWFVDGEKSGSGSEWRFVAPRHGGAPASHKVEVEVADSEGLAAPRVAWDVEVGGTPPKIAQFEPRRRELSLTAGQSVEFSVVASSSDGTTGLEHEWILDGSRQRPRGASFELPSTLSPGKHDVQVAALDSRGMRSAAQRWVVSVAGAASAPSPVRQAPTPRPEDALSAAFAKPDGIQSLGPRADTLSEAEVRQWLGQLQDAWAHKDVGQLAKLGAISEAQRGAVENALKDYKKYEVAIRNEVIKVDGKSATVSFERIDTDESGRTMVHPRQTYHLDKRQNTIVASRAPSGGAP